MFLKLSSGEGWYLVNMDRVAEIWHGDERGGSTLHGVLGDVNAGCPVIVDQTPEQIIEMMKETP